MGHPYPEVTGAICRVPSTPFSQAPWYTLPVHLCWFRVRSTTGAVSWNTFAATTNPISGNNLQHSSHPRRPRNINLVPIAYGFRPRLRGRLTLRGLALRRNPWTFGESVSHTLYRYSCQHSHFRYLQHTSRYTFTGLRNAPLPLMPEGMNPQLRWTTLAPLHLRRRTAIRPVSCYAFFQGWLLLSQPPGCLGLPTSFPT